MKGRNTSKNTLTAALRPRIARRATQQIGSVHPLPPPILIDERHGSRNLEDVQPKGTNFTVRELIDVNTSNEQLAFEHLSAHLGSGTDYKIEFKSQLHVADHWREAIGLKVPVVGNSQKLFSSSTTEVDPAGSERSSCQKESPYQEELTTEQNPTGPNQSRRSNLAAQEAGATDNQNFLPAGQPNSGQLPDGRNMPLSRWATMKGTPSECRREEKHDHERGIMWNISMETQILGVACEIPFDPGPSRSP